MQTHGIQTWDGSGRETIGYDNPCILLDNVAVSGSYTYPPVVGFNWFDYGQGRRYYTLSSNSKGIAVVGGSGPFFLVFEVF